MSDSNDPGKAPEASSGMGGSIVEHAAHIFIMAHTGIPPQIQKSLYKTIGSVIGHSGDVVNAFLDRTRKLISARGDAEKKVTIAKGDAEAERIKAQRKADNLIIKRTGEVAARAIEFDDLESRARRYRADVDTREQANREDVVLMAIEQIAEQPPATDAPDEINTDWIAAFLAEAGKRSGDDFKQTFSRILAGEIKAPGTFSIGMLQSVPRLTQETAGIFQRFCNLSLNFGRSAKISCDPFGEAGQNSMLRFGLSYDELVRLVEDGLVRPDFREYQDVPVGQAVVFDMCGQNVLLINTDTANLSRTVRFTGPSLTQVGIQLRSVLSMTPDTEYVSAVTEWLLNQQYALRFPSP